MSYLPDGNNLHRGRNILCPDAPTVPAALRTAFWFDFTNAATMYSNATGTKVAADGDNINVIRDANGTAICMRQNNTYLTYRTGIVAGNSVGRCPGGADTTHWHSIRATTVAGGGIPSGADFTLANVFTAGKNAMTAIMAVNLTSDGTQRHVIGDNTGGFWFSRHVLFGGQSRFAAVVFDSGSNKEVDQNYTQSNWAVLTWRQGATQNQSRRNGGAWVSIACTGPASLANFFRFSSGFTFAPMNGDVAELALFPSALSDAAALTVEKYFGLKVGITI